MKGNAAPPFRHRLLQAIALILSLTGLVAGLSAADKKLILKDGTDQQVGEYEVKGDRVRFYSTERKEWEEMPNSLVDWKATEEFNASAGKEVNSREHLLDDLEPPKPVRPKISVAPGTDLPESQGVYVYDGSTLLSLFQIEAQLREDTTRRVLGALAPVPGIVRMRQFAEISGAAAKVSVAGPSPVFFLQLIRPSPQGYGILRLKVKEDSRIVGQVSVNPLTQNESESEDVVQTASEQIQPESEGVPAVIRMTLKQPLKPGEYAVVEFAEKGKLNLFVWEFGVHEAGKKSR